MVKPRYPASAWRATPTAVPQGEATGARHTDRLWDHQATHIEFSLADHAQRKRLASLRACPPLNLGHVMHELADGSFLATASDLSCSLPTLDGVATFLQKIGGVA